MNLNKMKGTFPFVIYIISLVILISTMLLFIGCSSKRCKIIGKITPEAKEKLLRERVTKMWQAQVQGDRTAMYELYDPFFRAKVSKVFFSSRPMPAHYYNPEIVDMDIKGNVAIVRVSFEYEIKGLRTKTGTIVNQAKRRVTDKETWLYIDGQWWRQFIDYMTDGTFAIY